MSNDGRLREPVARVLAVTAAVLFAAVTYLVWAKWPPLIRLDLRVAAKLHEVAVAHAGLVTAFRHISSAGTTLGWLVILSPLAGWLCYRRELRLTAYLVSTVLLSSLLNTAVKAVIRRPRPTFDDPLASAHATSFPSGHAQAAVVCVGVASLILFPRVTRWGRAALGLAGGAVVILIGLARITLGVHYLSDVIGGYLLGTAFLLGTACLVQGLGWLRPALLSDTVPARTRPG